ncbi:MAG: helix-turn-helix transcriptional regulator [Clostridia bacterium]|nr:helix-turn-helix transcriptional regulator [Clostridia bacterium]
MNSHLKLKNRLKEYRQRAGLTQSQLALKIGSSKNTISSIETGQFCPTAYLAMLLCLELECTFEDLFYFEANR